MDEKVAAAPFSCENCRVIVEVFRTCQIGAEICDNMLEGKSDAINQ